MNNAPSILLDNYSPTAFEKLVNFSTDLLAEPINGTSFGYDNRSYQNEGDISPADFAVQRLRILDKNKRLVPLIYNRVQADLISHLTGRDLVLKSRQQGASTVIQGLNYQKVVTGTATTMTLAHDDDGTKTLRRMADRFHRHDPRAPRRGAANDRLSTYPEFDSEALIATAGNKASGRSTTLTFLHGSEVAYWPDAESIVAGAMQAGNPDIILESTPNGAQGYFYTLCMEALTGNSPWTLHFYPWWWDDGYRLALEPGEVLQYTAEEAVLVEKHGLTAEQIKWRRSKQAELKQLFAQEYPEDPVSCFLQSGNGYFGDLSGVFTAQENPVYNPEHRYVAGLDFGQTNDYTALKVLDATIGEQVDGLRLRGLPWKEMRRQVIVKLIEWNVSVLAAERNSMGSTNIEALITEMGEMGCNSSVMPFDTTNASKYMIMGNLHTALHERVLRLQEDPVQRHQLTAFIAVQLPSGAWKLTAPDGEHDDDVIGLGLSWFAAGNATFMVSTVQSRRAPLTPEEQEAALAAASVALERRMVSDEYLDANESYWERGN